MADTSMQREEIEVKRLLRGDEAIAQQLFLLLQEVFEVENPTTVKETYLEELLRDDRFIVYYALYKQELAGGLTAYELPKYFTECSELFIYDIAVRPSFQRLGIGRKLLKAISEHGRQMGIQQFFVDACESDEHAVEFYHSTGGNPESVIQFTYPISS